MLAPAWVLATVALCALPGSSPAAASFARTLPPPRGRPAVTPGAGAAPAPARSPGCFRPGGQRDDTAGGRHRPSPEEEEAAAELRRLLNRERVHLGLAPLAAAATLDLLAYQHASEMARRGQVTHYSHEFGVSTRTRVRLAFPAVLQFAENVARNRDVPSLHAALQASRGHRHNRLDPAFTHVGIGVARRGPWELYVAELFVRAPEPAVLAAIHRLYSEVPAEELARDEPTHGEVVAEKITVAAPERGGPEEWTQRGIEAYVRGRYEEAVALFERALAERPEYAYARYDLGRALIAAGRPEEALEHLRRYLATEADDLDARITLGTAQLLSARYREAEGTFRAVLTSRPRDAGAWYNLGLALEYQDRLAEAERAYAQALHLQPSLAAAAAGIARVRRRR